jgi:hypothetical protein
VTYAAGSACMFALFDVLLQKWSPTWGVGRLLPTTLGFVAVLSLGTIPFFRTRLSSIPRAGRNALVSGCIFMGLQSLVIVLAIASYHSATVSNIIYSSRGLWSVVAVWAIGHRFGSGEQDLSQAVLRSRLFGATLMMIAIMLVLL